MWCPSLAVSLAALFTGASALQGRPAVVHFHDALLAGQDARDALARLDSMETGVGATPDVVTYSLVAATLLDAGLEAEADGVLERGAAFSKKRAAYRKPTKRAVVSKAAAGPWFRRPRPVSRVSTRTRICSPSPSRTAFSR